MEDVGERIGEKQLRDYRLCLLKQSKSATKYIRTKSFRGEKKEGVISKIKENVSYGFSQV